MKHLFVPYELAIMAKEKGFDEPCLATYSHGELSRNPSHKIDAAPIQEKPYVWINSKVHNSVVAAPLYQQLIDWFREEKDIHITIGIDPTRRYYFYGVAYIPGYKSNERISSYYEAMNEAIKEAFELI